MADYTIFTDAAADIPLEWYCRYDIQGVSMDYMLSEETNTIFPAKRTQRKTATAFMTLCARVKKHPLPRRLHTNT